MLHTPQAQLQQRLIALQQTLQATPAGMPLARTLASWLTRLHDQPATLLLLGNYNAGKSTLVNVLSGEALAPTGDIPLTDRVIDYPWQGLCLRDTPGLNAPIPHQAVTEAALASADLVVVVVRSGDVDEACFYRQLATLLQRGNPMLIVLNGDSSEPALLACWQQQLCRHLLALEQEGIPPAQLAAIPVIPLNLETAWQARQQGGPPAGRQRLPTAGKHLTTVGHPTTGRRTLASPAIGLSATRADPAVATGGSRAGESVAADGATTTATSGTAATKTGAVTTDLPVERAAPRADGGAPQH
ncbi:GTPase [Aeromonas veronii]|uniref:GTPase n=1 Tax=Aeromonas veronii TaxID=654 RepID=UPI0024453218|nr:GTPase [Aeromonas veronii]